MSDNLPCFSFRDFIYLQNGSTFFVNTEIHSKFLWAIREWNPTGLNPITFPMQKQPNCKLPHNLRTLTTPGGVSYPPNNYSSQLSLNSSSMTFPNVVKFCLSVLLNSGAGTMVHFCSEMPVFWFRSILPCAVIVTFCPGIGFRTNTQQFWKTAAAFPKWNQSCLGWCSRGSTGEANGRGGCLGMNRSCSGRRQSLRSLLQQPPGTFLSPLCWLWSGP